MPRYKRITLFLICCLLGRIALAQSPSLDERAFRAMSDAERYRFVHDFSFTKFDSAAAHQVLKHMRAISLEKEDSRTLLAILYRRYTDNGVLNPRDKKLRVNNFIAALAEMEYAARQNDFEAEEVAGRFYLKYMEFIHRDFPREKMYVEIQRTFEKMKALGFDKFSDYNHEFILRYASKFMWDIEDYEEAYRYLSVAEYVIQPTSNNQLDYTTVLNLLRIYWQEQKKDYLKAIEYAQKIRQFYQHFQFEDPKKYWVSRFWQGFALLSIAEIRLMQGDTTGVEVSADEGYAWTKRAEGDTDIYTYLAEYEALQVYVPIKMAFGKLDEAGPAAATRCWNQREDRRSMGDQCVQAHQILRKLRPLPRDARPCRRGLALHKTRRGPAGQF
jgi:tetratricopeptide (TPR) repeat protein